MEKILIKKIWFNNKTPISIIDDYKNAKEDNCININKFSKEEWKAYIFCEYKDNKLNYRKKLIIEGEASNVKIGDTIQIRISKNSNIGEGKLYDIRDNKYIIKDLRIYKNNKPLVDLKDYFVPYKNAVIKDKDKFINGLFKINYDSIKYYLDYHFFKLGKEYIRESNGKIFYNVPEAKFSALCSYLAIKDMFLLKGYKLSPLDCFVLGEKLEYDALVLKEGVSINKRIYSKDEILATIEIKTSGYFSNSIEKIKDDFDEYMDFQKIDGIPHIYIAVHESTHYYKNVYKKLNEEGFIPMFCKLKETSDYITIPYEYNFDELLKKMDK